MAAAVVNDNSSSSSQVPVPGTVVEVRNQWLLQGDEGLAHRLQDEEFGIKYNWNRAERKTARRDVPLARVVQTEEEEQLQKKQFARLEQDKRRADEDKRIALQLEKEERMRKDLKQIERDDVRLAEQIQSEEQSRHIEMTQEDAIIAMQLQREELILKRNERKQREMEDRNIALRLQEREQQLAEMARIERELQRQQRLIVDPRVAIVERDTRQDNVLHRRLQLPIDEDDGLTDNDREDLLYSQDQEMARALQELELEQSTATLRARRDQAYDFASSDARLARIMQEQERLDALRRAEERRIRRAERERLMRPSLVMRSETAPPPYDPLAGELQYRYPARQRLELVQPADDGHRYDQLGTVTYLQPRPERPPPPVSSASIPEDFLRLEPSGQVNGRLQGHPTRSQSAVETERDIPLPRQRPKQQQSSKNNCKQQ